MLLKHTDGLSDKGVRALGECFCFTGASGLRDTLRHWCKRIGAKLERCSRSVCSSTARSNANFAVEVVIGYMGRDFLKGCHADHANGVGYNLRPVLKSLRLLSRKSSTV
ncbi:MAG: hypothetical protein OXC54_03965 [Rhodospirillaceae bacterium]|nr:hypothetical protein [Rhodospirillaceae bacterium]